MLNNAFCNNSRMKVRVRRA